jgi:(p)ppGpp synthase/HD superfamily hydrolase
MFSFRLNLAKLFCIVAHHGQKRKYTGEPYHTHPFAVSSIVRLYGRDLDTQIAALLHDTVEDTWVKSWMIRLLFGPIVQQLVSEVTDVSKPTDGNRKARKQKDLQHLSMASADGQTIKIADLIHNWGTIRKHDPDFAKVYLSEARAVLGVLYRADPYLTLKLSSALDGLDRK